MLQQEKNTTASENMPPHLRGLPPQAVMMQMASGYWITQLIYAAAKLGIADLLKDGPKSCEEIAAATGTKAKPVYRVLRTLAGAGVFAETEPGYFTLTPLAASLQSSVSGSMRAMAVFFGEEQYQAWGEILYSLRTGKSSFEHMYGVPMFKYFVDNPEPGEIYEEAMTSVSAAEKAEILKSYDFSYIKKLVEVGGGHGSFISSILKANPTMQGVLFDQPYVIEGAKDFIKEQGLTDRCELVAGNFYESVPAGGDAYSLKHVLHGCSDEQSITILKNCHSAMVEHGKLLIVERIVGSGPDSFLAKFLDVNMMMLVTGGCERTEIEYRKIIEASGFEVIKVVPSKAGVSVIESIRV
ncbi:MAG: hypothetical protein JOZ78_20695 [Chroococcidiopsidaceae cyanobacterium CP_BM_ER_R8_30]|nr:hypothetical protein [Chroococcidiopsidaceae cyanobacterium CP_BM_ER_R8_30]